MRISLDSEQLAAARAREPYVVVLAAAGSGKTTTVVERILWLIENGCEAQRLAVTTFTRKAAGELVERIRHRVGESSTQQLLVATFHSHCARWLKAVGHRYYEQSAAWSRIQPWEQSQAIRKFLADAGERDTVPNVKACLSAIAIVQNSLWSRHEAEQNLPKIGDLDSATLAAAVDAYRNAKRIKKRYDYDDLQEAVFDELHAPRPRSLPILAARHLLVDEAQDLNVVQVRILEALRLKGVHQTLVGDDYQSIYGFRSARPDLLIDASASRDWKTYFISTNYRSRSPVVTAGNNLIFYNLRRTHKKAKSSRGPGPLVRFETSDTQEKELATVLSAVEGIPAKLNGEPDAAVLVRTHRLARVVERDLIRHGISYSVMGNRDGGLFQQAETKPLSGWIRMIINDSDAEALMPSFSAPSRFLKRTDAEAVVADAGKRGLSAALRRRGGRWPEIADELERLRTLVHAGLQPPDLLRALLDLGPPSTSDSLRTALLQRATSALVAEVEVAGWNDNLIDEDETLIPLVSQFVQRTSFAELGRAASGEPLSQDRPVVSIGTIHQAKGLEWSVVCLPFFVEGTIPDFRAAGAILEEERRLAYVAATRAKDTLVVSWSRGRYSWSRRDAAPTPSRFASELQQPPNIIVRTRSLFTEAAERMKTMFRR
jgi:DNA helicase-2/ATP-dependent DNA helicase PcrA